MTMGESTCFEFVIFQLPSRLHVDKRTIMKNSVNCGRMFEYDVQNRVSNDGGIVTNALAVAERPKMVRR
jgi:hypothetical protein